MGNMDLKIYKRDSGKLFVYLPNADKKEIKQYKSVYDHKRYKFVLEGE